MKNLELIDERTLDPTIDTMLPLGGDGPPIAEVIGSNSRARMYYLTQMGERCHSTMKDDHLAFESVLFWLLLRNRTFLPLIQQIILNPISYDNVDVAEVMSTADSVSKNVMLHWLRYFSLVSYVGKHVLQVRILARRLLTAAILEINHSFVGDETYYVKEIDRKLNEAFSLSSTATDFTSALSVIFQHSKASIQGYSSSRGDVSLPNFPRISILKFVDAIPVSVAVAAPEHSVLQITRFARSGK